MGKLLVAQSTGAGFDYDGKRVVFDSICRFNGRPIIQCGLYEETADGTAHVRVDTVVIDQFAGQYRVAADRVIERIDAALLEAEKAERESNCMEYF